MFTWGDPILLPVAASDTAVDVIERAIGKMTVGATHVGKDAETIRARRWFFVSGTSRPEYLADRSANLGERFMRSGDLGGDFLAVEHADNRPHSKRREAKTHGWAGRGDGGGIRIGG